MVDVHQFAFFKDVLRHSCEGCGDVPTSNSMEASTSYAELVQGSRDFVGCLQNSLKLIKGDRAAIMMPNLLQYPVALSGVLRAGLMEMNVIPQYTVSGLKH